MRLRHIIGAEKQIADNPDVLGDAVDLAGKWRDIFGNDQPIYLEIGIGKGRFLMESARLHPEINYVGIEKYATIMLKAVQRRTSELYKNLENVRLFCINAEKLEGAFAAGEVDRIYLNFSDPWPKERYAKRRLTSGGYLKEYRRILSPGGTLEFKTDNKELFAFSLEELHKAGWELLAATRNLHENESMNEGNVLTEYEEKFSAEGNPICKFIARPADNVD